MHETLTAVRDRPGLYLGLYNNSFTALCGFITGYQVGYHAGAFAHSNTPAPDSRERACLVPHDFHRFVAEYYGEEHPAGGRGWSWFVREHASDDQAAFRLFFELLAEYDRRHPVA